jgi:hypothetical protein
MHPTRESEIELYELTKQRDELLAALEAIIDQHGRACTGFMPSSQNNVQDWTNAHYKARAAIAQAKGE